MKSGQRVLLDGYYGMQNTGDDVFCVVGAHEVARAGHSRPGFVALALPALPVPGDAVLAGTSSRRGARRQRAASAAVRYRRVLHFGGSTFRRMNRHRRDQDLLARAGLLELHAAGISIGPFRNSADERETVRFLRRFRSVAVRDAPSAERASALGLDVVEGFDVAVLLPQLPWADHLPVPPRQEGSVRRLAISVCPVESEGDERHTRAAQRLKHLVAAFERADNREQLEVVLLEFNGHPQRGDGDLSRALATALQDVCSVRLVPYSSDVRRMVSVIRGCDALVGMRLHSGILAYAHNVPFALVNYHPKCREFAETIGLDRGLLLETGLSDGRAVDRALEVLLQDRARTPWTLPLAEAQARARAGLSVLHASPA